MATADGVTRRKNAETEDAVTNSDNKEDVPPTYDTETTKATSVDLPLATASRSVV